jgi:hypothetical protein
VLQAVEEGTRYQSEITAPKALAFEQLNETLLSSAQVYYFVYTDFGGHVMV